MLEKFVAEYPQYAGDCWSQEQLQQIFEVEGFGSGFCVVTRKSDGKRGSLDYTRYNGVRVYFDFQEA